MEDKLGKGTNSRIVAEGKSACHRGRLGWGQKGNWGHWWEKMDIGEGIGVGTLYA